MPGAFGKVYRGLWRGTQVAIKTILLPARMSGAEKRERMVRPVSQGDCQAVRALVLQLPGLSSRGACRPVRMRALQAPHTCCCVPDQAHEHAHAMPHAMAACLIPLRPSWRLRSPARWHTPTSSRCARAAVRRLLASAQSAAASHAHTASLCACHGALQAVPSSYASTQLCCACHPFTCRRTRTSSRTRQ